MKTILFILFINISYASDNWFCKEVSTEKGDTWYKTCGIGYGETEHLARGWAMVHAYKEFKVICSTSEFCKNMGTEVEPKRTTCDKTDKGYVCHRLFQFNLVKKSEPTQKDLTYGW